MKKNFIDNLLTLTNKEITFNKEQWKAYKKGILTLEDVYKINRVDKEIGKLNKTAYNLLAFMVAGVVGGIEVYKNTLTVQVSNPVGAIDTLGNTFLGIFQGLGRWVALIMAFIEIVKSIMKGSTNTSEIFGIIFKYVIVFATMYLLPYFFDVVASAF
ncbi:hypothetical protein [Clostridium nigeriense]|uniref:hypothetical protein n=1 Tax=Clostridium nigeriense TaxID=1805470 RepID=UPI0008330272|nr:hypothetical protein [Clostridium nigeriense]